MACRPPSSARAYWLSGTSGALSTAGGRASPCAGAISRSSWRRAETPSCSTTSSVGNGSLSRPEVGPRVSVLQYVELHCHSAYSFLDGASLPEELALRAVELGYPALALTDHDGLYGSLEFAHAAKAIGLR